MNVALVLRDARCDARRPRTYAIRVFYGLALAFVLERAWSAVGAPRIVPTASDLAHAGRQLYGGFFLTQYVALSLLALVGGAESLARELRSGTMRLLVLTPVTESGIVASKWGAAMLQSAALALCGAPALAACAYLGAIGVEDVAAGLGVTLANAALAAACGLRGASTARTPGGAIFRGALGYLGWALVPAVLAIPTAGVALLMGPFMHPLYTAYYLRSPNPVLGGLAVAASAVVVGLVVRCVLRRSAVALERRMRDLPDLLEPPAPADPPRPWALTWWPGRWRRGAVWDDAPLLWKDLFTRPAALLSSDTTVGLALAAFGVWYLALTLDQGRSLAGLNLQLGVLAVLAGVVGAGLFTREKEGRRLEPLFCTPVSTARIVGSRLFAQLLSPEAAAAAAMLAVTVVVNARGVEAAIGLAAILLLVLAVAYLVSAAASLRMPTMHSAVALAAGVLAGAWLVLPASWPGADAWVSPGHVLLAMLIEGPSTARLGRFVAVHLAVAAGMALWIVARLRPIVLEARG